MGLFAFSIFWTMLKTSVQFDRRLVFCFGSIFVLFTRWLGGIDSMFVFDVSTSNVCKSSFVALDLIIICDLNAHGTLNSVLVGPSILPISPSCG